MSEIRIWEIQHSTEDRLETMSESELLGAEDILSTLHQYLQRVHFQEQQQVNVRALTKTIEELHESCIQLLYYKHKRNDLFTSTTPTS